MRTVLWEGDPQRALEIAPVLARGGRCRVCVVDCAEALVRELRAGEVGLVAMARQDYGRFARPELLPELLLVYEQGAEFEWRYVLPLSADSGVRPGRRNGAPTRIPAVGDDRRIRLLRPHEIAWLKAAGRSTVAATSSAQYRVSLSITELERRLQGHGFLRVNRSILLRTDAIRELQPLPHGNFLALMTDGASFVTSRQRDVLADIENGHGALGA